MLIIFLSIYVADPDSGLPNSAVGTSSSKCSEYFLSTSNCKGGTHCLFFILTDKYIFVVWGFGVLGLADGKPPGVGVGVCVGPGVGVGVGV